MFCDKIGWKVSVLKQYGNGGIIIEDKDKEKVRKHASCAINGLKVFAEELMDAGIDSIAKADKLSYWIELWTMYLRGENEFNSRKLRRYKRGEVIKVNLGFNVGSEEGGLHYAVVIDTDNKLSDPTIRIVPLTSVKPEKDINNLPSGNVYLRNELYANLSEKISIENRNILQKIEDIKQESYGKVSDCIEIETINKLEKEMQLISRMTKEINKMKEGSVALVNQITTISKMRIYDPKTNHDILSNIKISDESLNLIDESIIKMYTKVDKNSN